MTEEEENWNTIKTEPSPEPEDEVKVRVWFEDNNYFDDHLILKNENIWSGKHWQNLSNAANDHFYMTIDQL